MRGEYKIFDADAHVIEPMGVFGAGAAATAIDLPASTPMIPCGDPTLLTDQFENGFDAPSYLRAMDAQGIDVAVLYPSVGLFAPFQPQLDAAASAAACRAYNLWIAEYCATAPSRLAGVGVIPLIDPALAAKEVAEASALGLVGVLVRPNYLYGRNLGDRAYDPVYDACENYGVVLAVHEGLGVRGPTIGSDRFSGFTLRHMLSHPLEQMAALASLVVDGALERHPALRVAFLESGTAWLPYWLSRLDQHREWMRESECSGLSLKPSEYFARQCVISCDPEDDLVSWTASRIGADHIVWASDFPHPDAEFPGAVDEFLEATADTTLTASDLRMILWDSPVRLYGLQNRVSKIR